MRQLSQADKIGFNFVHSKLNKTQHSLIKKFIKYTLATFLVLSVCTFISKHFFSSEPKLLHHSVNEFGPVWVYENSNYRYLKFSEDHKITQSLINLSEPDAVQLEYQKMLLHGLFIRERLPEHVLIIGLGGGSIAKAINKLFPNVNLDIVEINPVINDLAGKYFEFEPNDNTKVFIEDGYKFITDSESSKYDLIILDACNKDYIPPSFITTAFLKQLKRTLTTDGVVSVNSFVGSQYNELENELYGEEFGEFLNIAGKSNRAIIASNSELPSLKQINKNAMWFETELKSIGLNIDLVKSLFRLISKFTT